MNDEQTDQVDQSQFQVYMYMHTLFIHKLNFKYKNTNHKNIIIILMLKKMDI